MEQLYHSTNRAVQEAHSGFVQCERGGMQVGRERKKIDKRTRKKTAASDFFCSLP